MLASCDSEELARDETVINLDDTISLHTDYIPLIVNAEGAHNVRDLGGFIMTDGRKLKQGVLYRAGRLDMLTTQGKSVLHDSCGVRCVIVFQNQHEQNQSSDSMTSDDGIKFINLPLFNSKSIAQLLFHHPDMNEETLLSAATDSHSATMAASLYEELFTSSYSQQQLATFLRELATTDRDGVLWHCSHGRDRSGVASALLLAALGASKQTIITDFEWGARLADSNYKASPTSISLCTRYFYKFLTDIEQEYGAIENYLLQQIGLTNKEISALRTKWLE